MAGLKAGCCCCNSNIFRKSLRSGGLPPPRTPPGAPAYRPVIGSIIKGKKLIKVGGGSRPPRTPPARGGLPNPPLCTGLSAGDRINH